MIQVTFNSLSKVFCTERKLIVVPSGPTINYRHNISNTHSHGGDTANRASTIITNEGIVAIPRHDLDQDISPTSPGGGDPKPTINGGLNLTLSGGEMPIMDKASSRQFASMQRSLKALEGTSQQILDLLKEKEVTRPLRQLRLDWQMVGLTLDRLFFLIFVIAIVVSLLTLFPRPYQMSFGN
jgi:hypothetical protein